MPIETFGAERDIEPAWKKYPRFRARKNDRVRCTIIHGHSDEMFIAGQTHFKERYFLCKNGICCHRLGPPRWRVACVLLVYHDLSRHNWTYTLHPWVFGERTYTYLRQQRSRGVPLSSHDFVITCSNEQFQQIEIMPCNTMLLHNQPQVTEQVYSESIVVREELCRKNLGMDLDESQITAFLNGALDIKALHPRNARDLEEPKQEVTSRYKIALQQADKYENELKRKITFEQEDL